REAEARGLALETASDFAAVPGQGVTGKVSGRQVLVGNAAFLAEHGIVGVSSGILVAVEGKFAGAITVADVIRPTTLEAIRQLRSEGMRIVMLTGDGRVAAEEIGKQLGIDE